MSYGLALAGGGTRGAAHVGILSALEEENLLPNSIAGTSAGSIVAGLYASGMSLKEMRQTVTYLSKRGLCFMDPDYLQFLRFIPQILTKRQVTMTGLIKGNRLLALLYELTSGITMGEAKLMTVIPAVDINSGNTIVYTNSKHPQRSEKVIWEKQVCLCEIMMASSSVPGIFCPRTIDSYCLVDGGVTNNLPTDLLISAGEKNVIAVDIGVDYEMPHDDSIMEITSHSYSIMSGSLKDCRSSGELLLLKPKLPKGAGLLTFERMEECMNAGYQYTKSMTPAIRRTLKQIKNSSY